MQDLESSGRSGLIYLVITIFKVFLAMFLLTWSPSKFSYYCVILSDFYLRSHVLGVTVSCVCSPVNSICNPEIQHTVKSYLLCENNFAFMLCLDIWLGLIGLLHV